MSQPTRSNKGHRKKEDSDLCNAASAACSCTASSEAYESEQFNVVALFDRNCGLLHRSPALQDRGSTKELQRSDANVDIR